MSPLEAVCIALVIIVETQAASLVVEQQTRWLKLGQTDPVLPLCGHSRQGEAAQILGTSQDELLLLNVTVFCPYQTKYLGWALF